MRTNLLISTVSVLLILFLSAEAPSQVVTGTRVIRAVPVTGSSATKTIIDQAGNLAEGVVRPGTQSTSSSQQANADAQSPEAIRLAKLLQLQFDRRGTVYLQQWSAANMPKPEKSADVDAKKQESTEQESKDQSSEPVQWKPSDLPPSPIASSPKKLTPEQIKAIDEEVAAFERAVILGQWEAVRSTLAALPKDDATKVYNHLLSRLATSPATQPMSGSMTPEQQIALQVQQQAQAAGIRESNYLIIDDISGLITAAPGDIDEDQVNLLSQMISLVNAKGLSFDNFVDALDSGIGELGGSDAKARQKAAKMLLGANLGKYAERFLPAIEVTSETDIELLKLHLSLSEQTSSREGKPEQLEQCWTLLQQLLAQNNLEVADRQSLLKKAVSYAGRIRDDLGEAWLRDSFTKTPERGLQIVANLGATVSENFVTRYQSPNSRIESLKLQNSAVESLIEVAPELASQWQPALNVLVDNWIQEAETCERYYYDYNSRPRMQLDIYGNYYWASPEQQQMYSNQQRPQAIPPNELILLKPGAAWQELIFDSQKTRFNSVLAKLYIKNQQEDESFEYIEFVCQRDPKRGHLLVNEFMRAWTRSHDPNSDQRNRNPYIYMYGYDTKADAIPLTRSKQERNLVELKGWIERIRALPIEPIDDKVLAQAFTTSHSQAEVYKLKAFESVFGSLDTLKPETIASIAHTMRENLAGKWRDVQLQEATQTKRKKPEIEKEVVEGYETAIEIVERALAAHPDSWQLLLAQASLYYEQNAYKCSLQNSSTFSEEREKAFGMFQNAADQYAETLLGLEESQHQIDAYQFWFYASLGACDVRRITHETVPDTKQHAKIRAALASLPGELADKHMAKFANDLFTRMSALKPQVKFRYLDGGFEIVGDHPRAEEARKVYQYYRDLVTEIKLEIKTDGTNNVGHQQPFGVFVNLIHTPEIERESGGFAKYVQNQNQNMYAYNYGRPTEDYRDKFEESTQKALGEHFEVLSVIFEDPKSMKSREWNGQWRITPYAYLLLKPRGPEVDTIPAVSIDFDFLDTSGYAVLPIQSQIIPIVCSGAGDPRPVSDLEITQTLDERRASEGKLILEVKANATGIVPDLETILDLKTRGFDVVSVDDQTVVPTKFDDTANEIQIKSDRSWSIEMVAADQQHEEEFVFPAAKLADVKNVFQRYDDADLVQVSNQIQLENRYVQSESWWRVLLPWLIGVPIAFCIAGVVAVWISRRPTVERQFEMPADVNPFTIIGLLKSIDSHGKIRDRDRVELRQSINRLEQHYFSASNGDANVDLEKLASDWIRKA
jgi:hypothetical protein